MKYARCLHSILQLILSCIVEFFQSFTSTIIFLYCAVVDASPDCVEVSHSKAYFPIRR